MLSRDTLPMVAAVFMCTSLIYQSDKNHVYRKQIEERGLINV